MAAANALTQGVAVVTGLQNSFDWRGVAASVASGAMGSAVGSALDSADAFGSLGPVGATFARAATTSFAAGAAAAVMRGGRSSIQQVASDAFGNALVAGLVSASQRPGEQEQLASAMGAQSVTLVDGTTISAAENLRRIQASGMRLAAGPGYSGGVPHGGDVIVPPYLPGVGYADERNVLPAVTVTASPDVDVLAERLMGGTQGVVQTAIDAVDSTATLLRNSLLQVGDILTFGMNHGHPVMQQAWAEQSALGQGLVHLAASPRQTATAAIQHASDRYAQAQQLRAQGDEIGAARIMGHLATSIAAGALGGVQGIRGAAQWGAAGLRAAGVADAQLVMQSVPSMGRQAGALGIEVKAFGNVGNPGLAATVGGGAAEPLLLGYTPTTNTLAQIRRMSQPQAWRAGEQYVQELAGYAGQAHFNVPSGPVRNSTIFGSGGRFVDAPVVAANGSTIANEVKTYKQWTTVNGAPIQQAVPLSPQIQQQVLKDSWLQTNVGGYNPRWIFLDALPSPELVNYLNRNSIDYVIHH